MEHNEILQAIQKDIADLKSTIQPPLPKYAVSDKWIPRPEVMRFFNYAPTQMATLEKSGLIVVARVGKRKFYLKESLEKMLEKNIVSPENPIQK